MVLNFLSGGAAANVLADACGVGYASSTCPWMSIGRTPAAVPADLTRFKIRRSSGAIDREDALSRAEAANAFAAGVTIADERSTLARICSSPATWVSATPPRRHFGGAGLPPQRRRSGRPWHRDRRPDMDAQVRRRTGRNRARSPAPGDPLAILAAVGGADFAAVTRFLLQAAVRGVPVILDRSDLRRGGTGRQLHRLPGSRLVARRTPPSTEPAHAMVLDKLDLATGRRLRAAPRGGHRRPGRAACAQRRFGNLARHGNAFDAAGVSGPSRAGDHGDLPRARPTHDRRRVGIAGRFRRRGTLWLLSRGRPVERRHSTRNRYLHPATRWRRPRWSDTARPGCGVVRTTVGTAGGTTRAAAAVLLWWGASPGLETPPLFTALLAGLVALAGCAWFTRVCILTGWLIWRTARLPARA